VEWPFPATSTTVAEQIKGATLFSAISVERDDNITVSVVDPLKLNANSKNALKFHH